MLKLERTERGLGCSVAGRFQCGQPKQLILSLYCIGLQEWLNMPGNCLIIRIIDNWLIRIIDKGQQLIREITMGNRSLVLVADRPRAISTNSNGARSAPIPLMEKVTGSVLMLLVKSC